MTSTAVGDLTEILIDVGRGVEGARDRLIQRVYRDLHAIARNKVKGNSSLLEATVVLHEAYFKLFAKGHPAYDNRHHFFWAASRAMRDVLIEDYRHNGAAKRGSGRYRVDLGDHPGQEPGTEAVDLLALNEAIDKLAVDHPTAAQVVMLRFFAGLSRREAAAEMKMSEANFFREWMFAKVWLLAEIEGK